MKFKELMIWCLSIGILNLFDMITTLIFYINDYAIELNPLMNFLLDKNNQIPFILVKLLFSMLVLGIPFLVGYLEHKIKSFDFEKQSNTKFYRILFSMVTVIYLFVVLNNLIIIYFSSR